MSARGASRGSLPTISNPQLSYSQRYEHMTKLANYSEMNEGQIWKEYEKLRACLKELNEEVLHHMQKKAFGSIGKVDKPKPTKDQEGTLILLEDEKKTNDTRVNTYTNELARHEDRIKFVSSRPNYLQELNIEGQQLQMRIKAVTRDNKDLKRKAELMGKDLVNNTSILDRLMIEEQKLTRVFKQHRRYDQHNKILNEKIQRFKEKVIDLQKAIDLRVEQFSQQENFIEEEIHLQRYQELKKQKETISKYEPIYKRNYLMKLKELEAIVNNMAKQDKIIHQTETNIITVRTEIEEISNLVGAQRKRYHSSLMHKKQEKVEKMSVVQPATQSTSELQHLPTTLPTTMTVQSLPNDKNRENKMV